MHIEDFRNRENILLIMRSFYDKLLADSSISYLFTEIAHLDLEHHFPWLLVFWDSMLFGTIDITANATPLGTE